MTSAVPDIYSSEYHSDIATVCPGGQRRLSADRSRKSRDTLRYFTILLFAALTFQLQYMTVTSATAKHVRFLTR